MEKSLKKEMRRIAGIAYQRELDEELRAVYKDFKKWEKGALDCFQLNEIIHKFHVGVSRQLYKINMADVDYLAARAIGLKIIKPEEVNPVLMNYPGASSGVSNGKVKTKKIESKPKRASGNSTQEIKNT